MSDWFEERRYCEVLNFKQDPTSPNRYVFHLDGEPEEGTFITFMEHSWAFTSGGQLVYCSSTNNLSHVLENNSAVSEKCPKCGCEECAAYYFEQTDVTYFWNCEADMRHVTALKGYRLDERDHVRQLQERLRKYESYS